MRVAFSIFLFVACMTTGHAGQLLGVSTVEVEGGGIARPLSLSVWYPTANGAPEEVGGSAVFMGVSAVRSAPIVSGKFPLFSSHMAACDLRTTPVHGWLQHWHRRGALLSKSMDCVHVRQRKRLTRSDNFRMTLAGHWMPF